MEKVSYGKENGMWFVLACRMKRVFKCFVPQYIHLPERLGKLPRYHLVEDRLFFPVSEKQGYQIAGTQAARKREKVCGENMHFILCCLRARSIFLTVRNFIRDFLIYWYAFLWWVASNRILANGLYCNTYGTQKSDADFGPLNDTHCNKQSFTLYCCLSGPRFPSLFPWLSNAMCCNSIMCILSLVHQREEGADKSDDSLTLVVRTLNVPGNCSWNKENDYRLLEKSLLSVDSRPTEEARNQSPNIPGCPGIQPDVRRSLTHVEMSQLKGTHFGWCFAIFANFQPL